MIDVQKTILAVMKKQMFSETGEENQAARSVLGEMKTKQIDLRASCTIDAMAQNKLLAKMKSDRENSAKVYTQAGRADMAAAELEQAKVIAGLMKMLEPELPEQLSPEKIRAMIAQVIADNEKPNMGLVMKAFKDCPSVDRKLVSQIAGEMLK